MTDVEMQQYTLSAEMVPDGHTEAGREPVMVRACSTDTESPPLFGAHVRSFTR